MELHAAALAAAALAPARSSITPPFSCRYSMMAAATYAASSGCRCNPPCPEVAAV
ncbi:hypothetical protein CHLRE_17g716625v5 [Chlamydomonas reinhardtii]|uniref:Uncharacterized protein n=1 Tax=Chlamydomonas reinhardtii TaxID=3055 RepID=A0A2K3CQ02_CHLRE|nr:uncharacterized protein CHLRE_17g716625v5 [Chlamydomonas reinhardtii]XP_042914633.1 uncharacterized protein CHLRE_17g716625v5 [Chlamydomonas reinhardtii]PNW70360.1 hypothetical protein CHLRE_17g716625v5 [Chlamydomonas reinhardtii]PNW70361.1 hypothetical protein CHLRE_17g716625v5 [Chlamydomonas reinhardtii]